MSGVGLAVHRRAHHSQANLIQGAGRFDQVNGSKDATGRTLLEPLHTAQRGFESAATVRVHARVRRCHRPTRARLIAVAEARVDAFAG